MRAPACGPRAKAPAGPSRPLQRLPSQPTTFLPSGRASPPSQLRLNHGLGTAHTTSAGGTAQRLRGSTDALGSTAALRASSQRSSRMPERSRLSDLGPRACGIIGIYKASGDCNVEVYEGLLSLQVIPGSLIEGYINISDTSQ